MSEHATSYPTFKSLPVPVKAYIVLLHSFFLPLSYYILSIQPSQNFKWLDFFIFSIAVIALTIKPVLIEKDQSFQIDTIFWFACVLLFDPKIVFLIVLFSSLIGDIVSGTKKWGLAINTAQLSITYYIAALIFNTLRPSNLPFFEHLIANTPAILITATLIVALNYLLHLITYTFLYKEESFTQAAKKLLNVYLLYELSQPPIGILLAITYQIERFAIILFLLPILFFYITYHYQSRMQQKEREMIEEKNRIEQDAHDRIYNKLGALAKKAEIAANSDDARGEAKQTLDLLQKDLRTTVADLQQIVATESKSKIDEPVRIIDQLENICSDFKNRSTIKLDFNSDNSLIDKIDPKNFWHLQCILEECLNNVHKHSNATEVSVQLHKVDGSLILSVSDNGVGIGIVGSQKLEDIVGRVLRTRQTENRTSGLGLRGMKERAEKMNAVLSINPNNGKGTKVELKLPI